jgi:hypothetical protein
MCLLLFSNVTYIFFVVNYFLFLITFYIFCFSICSSLCSFHNAVVTFIYFFRNYRSYLLILLSNYVPRYCVAPLCAVPIPYTTQSSTEVALYNRQHKMSPYAPNIIHEHHEMLLIHGLPNNLPCTHNAVTFCTRLKF